MKEVVGLVSSLAEATAARAGPLLDEAQVRGLQQGGNIKRILFTLEGQLSALERSARSTPAKAIRPASGRSSPATRCRRVDLPEPEGPITQRNSPASRRKETSSRTGTRRLAGPKTG